MSEAYKLRTMGVLSAAAGTIVMWASAFVLVRVAVVHISPTSLAFLRFSIASLLVGVWACSRNTAGGRGISRIEKSDWVGMTLMGFFGITVYHVALNAGEQTVPAGTASLLINTGPIWVALMAFVVLKETMRWRGWIGMLIALVGATLLSLDELERVASGRGIGLILAAAVAQSIQFVYARRLVPRYGSVAVTAYTFWIGTLPLLPVAPGAIRELLAAPTGVAWAVLFLAVFPSALAYALWVVVLRQTPAVRASTWLLLVPLVAVGMGVAFLGERLSGRALTSAAVTVVGLVLMRGQQRLRASASAGMPPPRATA